MVQDTVIQAFQGFLNLLPPVTEEEFGPDKTMFWPVHVEVLKSPMIGDHEFHDGGFSRARFVVF